MDRLAGRTHGFGGALIPESGLKLLGKTSPPPYLEPFSVQKSRRRLMSVFALFLPENVDESSKSFTLICEECSCGHFAVLDLTVALSVRKLRPFSRDHYFE